MKAVVLLVALCGNIAALPISSGGGQPICNDDGQWCASCDARSQRGAVVKDEGWIPCCGACVCNTDWSAYCSSGSTPPSMPPSLISPASPPSPALPPAVPPVASPPSQPAAAPRPAAPAHAPSPPAPAAWIVGYWGAASDKPTNDQLATALQKGYNVIALSFADNMQSDGSFEITTNTGTTVETKEAISQQAGVSTDTWKYVLSFGGQNMNAPTLAEADISTYVSGFIANYQKVKVQFGFDGFDVDVENGLNANYIKALRMIFRQVGGPGGEFITMAPQPPNIDPEVATCSENPWNTYVPLVSTDIIDYVSLVMPQLYNNGMPYGDLAKYVDGLTNGQWKITCSWAADDAAIDGSFNVKIPTNKFVGGFPAVMPGAANTVASDWESSPTTIVEHYKESSMLLQTGGIMTWSIGWDAWNNWEFIDKVAPLFQTSPGSVPRAKK